jgi:hypothetical protein
LASFGFLLSQNNTLENCVLDNHQSSYNFNKERIMKSTLKFGFIALLIITFFFPAMALADKGQAKDNYEEGSGSSAMGKGKAISATAKGDHGKKEEGSDAKVGQGDAAHEDSGKHMGMEKGKSAEAKSDHKKEGS